MLLKVLIKHCANCEEYKQIIINGEILEEGTYWEYTGQVRIEGLIIGLKFCGHEVEEKWEEFICRNCC